MCMTHSESGQPCGFTPCAEYRRLWADLICATATVDNAEGHIKDILARESKELDEIKRLEAENAALAADVQKHKDRRQCFEDLLNRSIEHEREWTQRALKAEKENAEAHDRTKCPNCERCISDLRAENAVLRQDLSDVKGDRGALKMNLEITRQDNARLGFELF